MLITRYNKYTIYFFMFLVILFKIKNSFSHECKLKDTTPKEITIYNTCLSQKNSKIHLTQKEIEELKLKNFKLEKENLLLKDKLLNLKKGIYNLFNVFNK